MDHTLLLSSSLSSRSHPTTATDHSSNLTPPLVVVPHLSFRYRRRSRHRRRPAASSTTTAPIPPTPAPAASPTRPLHRIRTRIAVFDRSSRHSNNTSQPPSAATLPPLPARPPVTPHTNNNLLKQSPTSSTSSPVSSTAAPEDDEPHHDDDGKVNHKLTSHSSNSNNIPPSPPRRNHHHHHHHHHHHVQNTASLPPSSPVSTSTTTTNTTTTTVAADAASARPRRMLTNTSALKVRPVRRLAPPPKSLYHERTHGHLPPPSTSLSSSSHTHASHLSSSSGATASLTDFLRPSLIPAGYLPELVDPSFRAHAHLLRKLTLDDFDTNRYFFIHKPLAKVHAILTHALLSVSEIDHRSFPMSLPLRSAMLYVCGNSHRSLFVMTYAAQLKSTSRPRPAAESTLPAMVLQGSGLSDVEVSALDYGQELSSVSAAVTETTRRRLARLASTTGTTQNDSHACARLARCVTATCAYGAFLSSALAAVDVELTHPAISYAAQNLDGLPWKCSGAPISVDFMTDDVADFGSAAGSGMAGHGSTSKYKPKRERLSLTRHYDRHARATDRSGGGMVMGMGMGIGIGIAASVGAVPIGGERVERNAAAFNRAASTGMGLAGDGSSANGGGGMGGDMKPGETPSVPYVRGHGRYNGGSGKGLVRGIRGRVAQFLLNAFGAGSSGGGDPTEKKTYAKNHKQYNSVAKVTDEWMREAGIPRGDQLFEMNDEIFRLFGFHPFYLSTAAVDREKVRRALLFGAKTLLFASSPRMPRRLRFILAYVASATRERRRVADGGCGLSFERTTRTIPNNNSGKKTGHESTQQQGIHLHNGHSINSVYAHRTYDALSIMSAHAAFLAIRNGARPAELVAAVDEARVRAAMDRYCPTGSANVAVHSIGFPLSRRDCAAVLVAHALAREDPALTERDLGTFAEIFAEGEGGGEEGSREGLVEIMGVCSMWHCLERYATGALGFDIDFASNMAFGLGRAEPKISEFCASVEGKKIGLSLAANELAGVVRARSDPKPKAGAAGSGGGKRGRGRRGTGGGSGQGQGGNREEKGQGTGGKRLYKKRTSSALQSSGSVV